ncbi:MAG: MBL fold metallo-hydrolase [Methanospirillaceae archaeon]|nr:MBL fold metallo-hydrolase [Methanospirillaceae archaeon]
MKKPDITSSNSWIIRIGEQILLIDSGADREQMKHIEEILKNTLAHPSEPVLLLVSHAHMDHIYQGLIARNQARYRYILCVQESGARALQSGDYTTTAADLLHLPFQKRPADISLLTGDNRYKGKTRTVPIPGSYDLCLYPQSYETSSGITVISERLRFKNDEILEIWYTPGHSKDSICITYGGFMHLGDILFATNPAVAGIPGWDPAELTRTMIRLDWILKNRPISIIGSGHGNAQYYSLMQPHLRIMEEELLAMPPVIRIDTVFIRETVHYALDLIREANRIFPIIAGRIMVLAYYLEEIGEDPAAERVSSLFEGDTIDEFLSAFNDFYEAYRKGERIQYQVLLKALAITEKIQCHFPKDALESLIDTGMLRRASRLCTDFMDLVSGNPPPICLAKINLDDMFTDMVNEQNRIHSDDDIFTAAADQELFSRVLMHRIAHSIGARKVRIRIRTDTNPVIIADKDRLFDFFSALLERYNDATVQTVIIDTCRHEEKVIISFQPENNDKKSGFLYEIPGALIREVRSAGGWIEQPYDKQTGTIIIGFPTRDEKS